jgi:ABC-type uncharacterized transport system permease subunit
MLYPILALYALASTLYLVFFMAPRDWLARAAKLTLLAAFLAQTIDTANRGVHGIHPITSTAEAVAFGAWLLAGGYLLISLRARLVVVGGFVAPVALVLLVLARLTPTGNTQISREGLGALGRIHITLSTAGLALFALAAAVASIYLVSESQLRHKKVGLLQQRGPALATLDAIGHRCITFGFPLFTVAIVTGAIWVTRLPHLGMRPEYSVSIATWGAFAALLLARTTAGWQGRRAAWLTLLGFAGLLTVVVIYLLRALHGA